MVSEEVVCSRCDTIYDCHIGGALRGPRDEVVCSECYRNIEYHEAEAPTINEEK